jgi:pSer/pThr/pTyr-binding forkhead associated (FHA) protein
MPEIIVKLGDNIVQKNFFVKEPVHIGRAPDNEIVLENLAVSRSHATIHHEDGRYLLADLDSSNGTFVNGVRIKKTELADRDVISIGKHKLYFYDLHAAEGSGKATVMEDHTMMVESVVTQRAELAVHKGRQKDKKFLITESRTSIGRGSTNDIRLSDWFVSREHAIIERRGMQYFIRDLDSWRHTAINGKVMQEALLESGDTIQLGPTVQLVFSMIDQMEEQRTPARVPVELDEETLRKAAEAKKSTSEDRPLPGVVDFVMPDEAVEDPEPSNLGDPEPSEMQVLQGEDPGEPESGDEGDEGDEESWLDELEREASGVRRPMPERSVELASVPAMAAPLIAAEMVPAGSSNGKAAHPADEVVHSADAAHSADEAAHPMAELEESWPEAELENSEEPEEEAELEVELLGDLAHNEQPENPLEPEAAASPRGGAPAEEAPAEDSSPAQEILMWERALQNKNPLIRKQAARRLKQLTGKDYEY